MQYLVVSKDLIPSSSSIMALVEMLYILQHIIISLPSFSIIFAIQPLRTPQHIALIMNLFSIRSSTNDHNNQSLRKHPNALIETLVALKHSQHELPLLSSSST
jgi:hypothetical protein